MGKAKLMSIHEATQTRGYHIKQRTNRDEYEFIKKAGGVAERT